DCNRCVDENLVLLRARLVPVRLAEILDRALAEKRARQRHHAYEAARTIRRGLREHRIRPALEPGAARSVARRVALGIDADAALDEAADSWTLMTMQIGTAARRKGNAVAAQQEITLRQGLEHGRKLKPRRRARGGNRPI